MIEKIGFPLVLFAMLTIVLVETNIMTSGTLITVGLNLALALVLTQILALLYGFSKSLKILNKTRRHPLYSPAREASIHAQKK
ncbi:MAG: hypothetical protein HF976_03510 [ANME-2 cluster archaeon]|nr:hypothetical protein [ANME-2 cluster archaeon]MBC2700471.1 hypothetical protein [ANME-2 cluster archaeon]MBC2707647.1 hypothetical protein [ANME-2 cluster archaeon]MBC2748497.1 hypothetical protein [ANME-2 cluster archaeon]MBC2763116.1 hypothetical protein [ANME-2 cluster archaeon]